jgi:hypothetical protein
MEEIYVSTDIEADGPIPGENSMLSIGSAAFYSNGELISTYSANLRTLPGAKQDPDTMQWWATQPAAWKACRKDLEDPIEAMREYSEWLSALPGKPIFVGYPASYDFLFVYWYLIKFTGSSPFSFSALDIKTYAMAILKCSFKNAAKKNFPKSWFDKNTEHTHVAVDDAIEQGKLFCNMLKVNLDEARRATTLDTLRELLGD